MANTGPCHLRVAKNVTLRSEYKINKNLGRRCYRSYWLSQQSQIRLIFGLFRRSFISRAQNCGFLLQKYIFQGGSQ